MVTMIGSPSRPVRLGTRASLLAVMQSTQIAQELRERGLHVELVPIITHGDISRTSLTKQESVGVFAAALRQALLNNDCDLAVHSAKDLPVRETQGLTIAAYPLRAPAHDVLVLSENLHENLYDKNYEENKNAHSQESRESITTKILNQLPKGARLGTGSPRRASSIRALRPDLDIVDIRGNVPTRIARVHGLKKQLIDHLSQGIKENQDAQLVTKAWQAATESVHKTQADLDAVILASAGLHRLGWPHWTRLPFSPRILTPAPAQGALALEVRQEDLNNETGKLLATTLHFLDDPDTRLAVSAERAVLGYLETGCAAPIGVFGTIEWQKQSPTSKTALNAGTLSLLAKVTSLDGEKQVECSASTTLLMAIERKEKEWSTVAAEELGVGLAEELLRCGAQKLADLKASNTAKNEKEMTEKLNIEQ